MMQVLVNGEVTHTEVETLADLLGQLDYTDASVATAVDCVFVAAGQRAAWRLQEGQRIDIVAPIQGG